MGQFVAQALMDTRIIDLPLSPLFIQCALENDYSCDIYTLGVSATAIY
jgi:hypothetical protein